VTHDNVTPVTSKQYTKPQQLQNTHNKPPQNTLHITNNKHTQQNKTNHQHNNTQHTNQSKQETQTENETYTKENTEETKEDHRRSSEKYEKVLQSKSTPLLPTPPAGFERDLTYYEQ
jgi:hypothetical protein